MRLNTQLTLPIASTTEQPNLTEWDIVLLNSSGGKDSQTMIREVVRQADAAGVSRDRLVVVHADMGRVEWKGTKELAQEQATAYGLEFHSVKRELGDLLEHVEQRGMWPSPKARYCTSDHKRAQISKVVTLLGRTRRTGKIFRLLNCMGLRAEESASRRKKLSFYLNKRLTNLSRTVYDWLPIHNWTEDEVWASIKDSGIRYHKAYDTGMPRLSCVLCIFAPKSALILAGKHNPELLAEYVALEERIDHKFKVDLSMAEVQAAVEADEAVGKLDGKWNM